MRFPGHEDSAVGHEESRVARTARPRGQRLLRGPAEPVVATDPPPRGVRRHDDSVAAWTRWRTSATRAGTDERGSRASRLTGGVLGSRSSAMRRSSSECRGPPAERVDGHGERQVEVLRIAQGGGGCGRIAGVEEGERAERAFGRIPPGGQAALLPRSAERMEHELAGERDPTEVEGDGRRLRTPVLGVHPGAGPGHQCFGGQRPDLGHRTDERRPPASQRADDEDLRHARDAGCEALPAGLRHRVRHRGESRRTAGRRHPRGRR